VSPRLLTIMGSGETSPTMVKTHRQLLERLGPGPVPAVLLDTPFGFQENASDIAERAVQYFAQSVGAAVEVASFRSRQALADVVERERFAAQLRAARYVFAGPGSPTYALRQWSGTVVPELLADKLRPGGPGGAVTFASAAALTLGRLTVPVYEIYKVGEDPRWAEGLGLLELAGLDAAVIPHYDNAEGGNHDTRFCYLGERRLQVLESQMPPGCFVLGVDEHTACLIDLDAGVVSVSGLGGVTVRAAGRSERLEAGTTLPVARLAELAEDLRRGQAPREAAAPPSPAFQPGPERSPLLDTVRDCQARFDQALAASDVGEALRAVLELEDALQAWSADTLQSDQLDRGRAALRSMVVRLAELAEAGVADPKQTVGGYVEALLELRDSARRQGDWDRADWIRQRLGALGVEVRDTPAGTQWLLAAEGARDR
jgi:cyanophycinase-like exopeptidase